IFTPSTPGPGSRPPAPSPFADPLPSLLLNWNCLRQTLLHRLVFPALLAIAVSARAAAPTPGQLDASPTLFTVMAALNATGYDAEIDSSNNHPLRQAIRAEIAKKDIRSLPALKAF